MGRLGKTKHEQILNDTIIQLNEQGYKTIQLDGKAPTCIAVKNDISYAICIFGRTKDKNNNWKRTKTITFLEDWYDMFDEIRRIHFEIKTYREYDKNIERNEIIEETVKQYKEMGFNIIYLEKKSPDAIAYKNDLLFAVEVIGFGDDEGQKYKIEDKQELYNMFDGVMIKTFRYGEEDVFTQTYGKNNFKEA